MHQVRGWFRGDVAELAILEGASEAPVCYGYRGLVQMMAERGSLWPVRSQETLEIQRELAQKEPKIYSPYIAATLNNLGILNRAQNRPEETRKAFEEALKIYEAFAKQDPDQFSPLIQWMKKLLKQLPN